MEKSKQQKGGSYDEGGEQFEHKTRWEVKQNGEGKVRKKRSKHKHQWMRIGTTKTTR